MTPPPAALGGSALVVWRLERDKHLPTWDAAEGAFRVGGRWSAAGRRVLYTSLDPATTILEANDPSGDFRPAPPGPWPRSPGPGRRAPD